MRKAYFVGKGLDQKEIFSLSDLTETTTVTVVDVMEKEDIPSAGYLFGNSRTAKSVMLSVVKGLLADGFRIHAINVVKRYCGNIDLLTAKNIVDSLYRSEITVYDNYEVLDEHEWCIQNTPNTLEEMEDMLFHFDGIRLNGFTVVGSGGNGGYDVTKDGNRVLTDGFYFDACEALETLI